MTKRSKEEILEEIEEMHLLRKKVMSGEKIPCPKCGEYLIFYGKNSGKHPGIFCPNNDFEILIEYDNKFFEK